MIQKFSLAILVLSLSQTLMAQSFVLMNEGGGEVTYEVTSEGQVGMRFPDNTSSYKYDIIVPDYVEYQGTQYAVTSILPVVSGGATFNRGLYLNNHVTQLNSSFFSFAYVFPKRTESTPTIISSETYVVSNLILTSELSAYKSAWNGRYANVYFMPFDANGDTTRATMTDTFFGLYVYNGTLRIELLGTNNASATAVSVPSSIQLGGTTFLVFQVAKKAFANNTALREISLPDQMKVIGDSAFAGAFSLQTVTTKSKLNEIGTNAFENCSSLQNIVFKGDIKTIKDGAFSGCVGLRHLYFDNQSSVPELGDHVFDGIDVGQLTVHFPSEIQESVLADEKWTALFDAQGQTPVFEASEAEVASRRRVFDLGTGREVRLNGGERGLYVVMEGNKTKKCLVP